MEENNFEKQVRQKMDELKIPPSESVWVKVEMRIERKKPRRWILFFIAFLFFIFLAGGYWFYNSHYPAKENYAINKNDFKKEIEKKSELKNEREAIKINSFDSATAHQTKKDFRTDTRTALSSSKRHRLKITDNAKLKSTINTTQISTETLAIEKNEKANEEKKDISAPFQTPQKTLEQDELKIGSTVNNNINILKNKFIVEQAKETDTSKTITAVTNNNKLHSNKWEAGFLFAGGISGVGNKFLGLQNTLPADYQVSSGPGQLGPSPSKAENSFAFIAGVFAQKNIFKKTKLSFGINFKLFNTTNEVGAKHDSDKSFSAGQGNIYRNHFGFIELPVELKFQIINNKQFQLFWNAGVTVSQLLESNALQFNENTGFYFIDNSKFNKTKLGLSTGFAANIFSTEKTSLSIGPYFFYGLSKLSNEGLYDKKHFVFAGLRSEFLLKRK